jgi:hypothetical protein
MKRFKDAAIATVGEEIVASNSVRMVSPVHSKRSGDKKTRAMRIKGLLPEWDETDEFMRSSRSLNLCEQ